MIKYRKEISKDITATYEDDNSGGCLKILITHHKEGTVPIHPDDLDEIVEQNNKIFDVLQMEISDEPDAT